MSKMSTKPSGVAGATSWRAGEGGTVVPNSPERTEISPRMSTNLSLLMSGGHALSETLSGQSSSGSVPIGASDAVAQLSPSMSYTSHAPAARFPLVGEATSCRLRKLGRHLIVMGHILDSFPKKSRVRGCFTLARADFSWLFWS